MNTSGTDRIEKWVELNVPPERVWQALTDFREFGKWFRVNLESPFAPGQATRGQLAYPGYEHLTMEVVVKTIEPQRLFSYSWHPYAVDPKVDYSTETPTIVEFTLEQKDGKTLLRVTESGFNLIPLSRREKAYRMNTGGWIVQLKNIESYLTSTQ